MLQVVGESGLCVLLATRTADIQVGFIPISQPCALDLSYSAITWGCSELCTFQDLISALETMMLNELELKRVQLGPRNM